MPIIGHAIRIQTKLYHSCEWKVIVDSEFCFILLKMIIPNNTNFIKICGISVFGVINFVVGILLLPLP